MFIKTQQLFLSYRLDEVREKWHSTCHSRACGNMSQLLHYITVSKCVRNGLHASMKHETVFSSGSFDWGKKKWGG